MGCTFKLARELFVKANPRVMRSSEFRAGRGPPGDAFARARAEGSNWRTPGRGDLGGHKSCAVRHFSRCVASRAAKQAPPTDVGPPVDFPEPKRYLSGPTMA